MDPNYDTHRSGWLYGFFEWLNATEKHAIDVKSVGHTHTHTHIEPGMKMKAKERWNKMIENKVSEFWNEKHLENANRFSVKVKIAMMLVCVCVCIDIGSNIDVDLKHTFHWKCLKVFA